MVPDKPPHPSLRRRKVWRDGEQRQIVGQCLRAAYVPDMDAEIARLMGVLAKAGGPDTE